MYIMTSRPRTCVYVQAPFEGVTDWHPEPSSGPDCTGGGVAAVASPVKVLELDTHSSLEADQLDSSLPPVSVASMVSPFLCLDDSKSNTEMSERHVSPTPHDVMLTRALTARKLVRPLPSHRLALRYTSHHLDRFTSGSSSGHSSSDHSSSGNSILGHSLSGHASPDTTVADSSTPPRFVYPPLARTPQCSEAYLCWTSAPLSTMYLPMTSESSAEDSSSESFARPSHKRCRSPAATVTSSIYATRALVPSRTDLLLSRKRFRDSISPEDSVEEDIDANELADIEADTTAVEVGVDRDVVAGVDAGIDIEVDVGVDVEDEVEDEVESSDGGTMEVGVHVVVGIDIPDELEARSLIAGEERASLLEQVASLERSNTRLRGAMMMERARANRFRRRNMTITRSGMTPEEIEELVNRRVEEALATYKATRAANALEAESQSQNGSDGDNRNGGNGNGGDGNGGDGNGGNGNGGNGNPNENNRFLQNILDLYFKYFKLPEDVVNRILQVVLDLQHFKSSLVIFAATILQRDSF
ncbi:hypothetical protein Tco_0078793 [Tanacetum coccineum]